MAVDSLTKRTAIFFDRLTFFTAPQPHSITQLQTRFSVSGTPGHHRNAFNLQVCVSFAAISLTRFALSAGR